MIGLETTNAIIDRASPITDRDKMLVHIVTTPSAAAISPNLTTSPDRSGIMNWTAVAIMPSPMAPAMYFPPGILAPSSMSLSATRTKGITKAFTMVSIPVRAVAGPAPTACLKTVNAAASLWT